MERKRQREIAVGAVAALAIVAAAYSVRTMTPADGAASQTAHSSSGTAASTGPTQPKSLTEVDLSALNAPKTAPRETVRNPFRFKPKPPPPPPPPPVRPSGSQGTQQTGPVEPAPPPRIPLKFFGLIDVPGKGLNASLTDGRGVYRGFVGDVIEGRYRIVRIGVESIDLAYVDGRGSQTIRFTGQ
jgi:hypothetical protein